MAAQKFPSELALILTAKGLVDLHAKIQAGKQFEYPYPEKLQRGYNKLTNIYLKKGELPPSSLVELVNWCANKSLADWKIDLPEEAVSEDDYLLKDEEPTELCYEWSELEETDRGKFQQQLIVEVMKIAQNKNNPELYQNFRRMLSEQPIFDVVTKKNFRNSMPELSRQINEAYEEISDQYALNGSFHQCDRCGYIMTHTTKERLICGNSYCRSKYQPKFKSLKGISPFYLVKDDIFRFITVPGKAEIELEQAIKKFNNVQLEMWAFYDTYDLYLTFPDGEKWAVDVKDWSNPYALAKKVNENPFSRTYEWNKAFYVFPDKRHQQKEDYKRAFLKHFRDKEIKVLWAREFLQKVKSKLEDFYA